MEMKQNEINEYVCVYALSVLSAYQMRFKRKKSGEKRVEVKGAILHS